MNLALKNNYQLKASYLRKDAAKSNARSAASNHLPKIDIVGSGSDSETNHFNYEGFSINGQGIPVPAVTGRRNYAIQLSVPIFQGEQLVLGESKHIHNIIKQMKILYLQKEE
ncbi:MAG: hypothetical protein Ct9H90mP22_0690 [Gammaproteobacteria bacterium]|nr:MAG: hypothetical protein Ct9H90mP22_0690 [Gammaproteobacteria bacterium]